LQSADRVHRCPVLGRWHVHPLTSGLRVQGPRPAREHRARRRRGAAPRAAAVPGGDGRRERARGTRAAARRARGDVRAPCVRAARARGATVAEEGGGAPVRGAGWARGAVVAEQRGAAAEEVPVLLLALRAEEVGRGALRVALAEPLGARALWDVLAPPALGRLDPVRAGPRSTEVRTCARWAEDGAGGGGRGSS